MSAPPPGAPPPGIPASDITPITIEEEMRRSYLDYAMSVIVSRALPDVRDGLKPVHRRILYGMKESGFDAGKPYRKSARIVGDVMGKYHPHGDSAIYDAMVRMAQTFSMRLPLIDGQGNFGSMDGDAAAAMRYTEARLARSAEALLTDIDKDTVDFQPNYDDSTVEPTVLPAEFPNLLVNGAGGIAVGMATNIPTHNLGEVVDACCALIDDPDISIDALMEIVPGPDFPTGGLIMGKQGIMDAYRTGRGSIIMRGAHHIEDVRKDRQAIIVTEIPYQVNKSKMMERIHELSQEKVIEGIAELRDESDRDGTRVVIELKRDVQADIILNQLYKHSQLQTSFGANMLALNQGRPMLMNLREIIAAFVAFREQVITRRTAFLLAKARARAHVLVGLAIAVANIDRIIEMIRAAPDPVTARENLVAEAWQAFEVAPLIALIDEPDRTVDADGAYRLSETQARAILELRLQRLTGLEREKIAAELNDVGEEIKDHLLVLGDHTVLMSRLRAELVAVRDQFATPRRTKLEAAEFGQEIEDLIQREAMVVTVSHGGYVKRVPLSTYRAQRRGGKGRTGMATRDEDFVSRLFVADTHTPLVIFTTAGRAFMLKVWRLPEGTPTSRGRPVINLLPTLQEDERVATVMPLPEDPSEAEGVTIVFATSLGEVRRNALSDFSQIKANGKIAMKLEDEEGNSLGALVGVTLARDDQDILLSTVKGKCIRFPVTDVRIFTGRTSTGVRGIRLAKGDEVISLSVLASVDASTEERDAYLKLAGLRRRQPDEAPEDDGEEATNATAITEERFVELAAAEEFVLTVTEKGFGKRTSAYGYRRIGRGGQGVANMDITDRNGEIVAVFPVGEGDQIMLVTDGGQVIRTPVRDIRIAGRKTQGVTVFRVNEEEKVVSVSRVADDGESDEESVEESGPEMNGEAGGEGGGESV